MTATTATDDLAGEVVGESDAVAGSVDWCPGHPDGPHNELGVDDVLAGLVAAPGWATLDIGASANRRLGGARRILEWLLSWPGQGWQQRWLAAGADHGLGWFDDLSAGDRRTAISNRVELSAGLSWLFLGRVLRPGYDYFTHYRTYVVYQAARQTVSPELFARIENVASSMTPASERARVGHTLIRIALHTGKDLQHLCGEDLLEFRAWAHSKRAGARNVSTAWDVLARVGVLPAGSSLRAALRVGQRTIPELVDFYGVRAPTMRQVLIRYLTERRPSLDYNSIRALTAILVGNFWPTSNDTTPDSTASRCPRTWRSPGNSACGTSINPAAPRGHARVTSTS